MAAPEPRLRVEPIREFIEYRLRMGDDYDVMTARSGVSGKQIGALRNREDSVTLSMADRLITGNDGCLWEWYTEEEIDAAVEAKQPA